MTRSVIISVRLGSVRTVDCPISESRAMVETSITWETEGCEHLGHRILRFFPPNIQAHGRVTGWVPTNPDAEDEPALWRIEHDDGDCEDLSKEEVLNHDAHACRLPPEFHRLFP